MHGRDDTVLEQQFMTKSTTGYTSKPLGPGADRFMLQPYGRYTNASRFAGETDGLEAIESVAKAYPIDRNRIVMTGFLDGRRVGVVLHRALRGSLGRGVAGRRFHRDGGVPSRSAAASSRRMPCSRRSGTCTTRPTTP